MLIAAPTAEARPTRKAVVRLRVAKAVAKRGARVETEPSIRPTRPGWMTLSRKDWSRSCCVCVSSPALSAVAAAVVSVEAMGNPFSI